MIVRTWRGTTRAADADAYLDYLRESGLAAYQATPGNRGAAVLRRVADGEAEFLVVSAWDGEAAVRAFAGDDLLRAVFYPEDDRFLVQRDLAVAHYDLVYRAAAPAPADAARAR